MNSLKSKIFVLSSAIFIAMGALIGCQSIAQPKHDEPTVTKVTQIKESIVTHYAELSSIGKKLRSYNQFSKSYLSINDSFDDIANKNRNRESNEDMNKLILLTRNEWGRYQKRHKKKNSYPDILIKMHKNRLTEMLNSIETAEQSRKPAQGDN